MGQARRRFLKRLGLGIAGLVSLTFPASLRARVRGRRGPECGGRHRGAIVISYPLGGTVYGNGGLFSWGCYDNTVDPNSITATATLSTGGSLPITSLSPPAPSNWAYKFQNAP